MSSGLSLANKCQLLFGLAIVVLLSGVLAVPWFRSETVISDAQIQTGRKLVDSQASSQTTSKQTIRSMDVAAIDSSDDPFALLALKVFTDNPEQNDLLERTTSESGNGLDVRYARPERTDGKVTSVSYTHLTLPTTPYV